MMASAPIAAPPSLPTCPHCGFDIAPLATVQRGEWIADKSGVISFRGKPLPVGVLGAIVHTLIANAPHPVRTEVLADRMGYQDDTIITKMYRLRGILRDHGARDVIRFRHGKAADRGYYWAGD